jgi:Zn-dependent protease with chaperone function
MELSKFERMVARLEKKSQQTPAAYRFNVALLALLGFAILALIIGSASSVLLALVAVPFVLWTQGLHAAWAYVWLGKLLLLMAVPLWFLVRASLSALLTRFPVPRGLEVSREQAPALFKAIAEMRERMKGPRFHHVLVNGELNAAVVQRPLFGLFGPARNYLILGLPLLESLSPQEAVAVVAHEYGHLAGSHGRFGAFIYRLRNTWNTVHAISQHWQGAAGAPLRRLVAWYAPHFDAYTFVLARANEYQADAAAAELVGADVAARALKRVDVSSAHFGKFIEQTFSQTAASPTPPTDFCTRWANVANEVPAEQAPRWLRRALAVPLGVADTHPPLKERLRALQGEDATIAVQVPAPIEGPSAALAWLGEHVEAVRQSMQQQWLAHVTTTWEQQHEAAKEQRQRLDVLRAIEHPSQADHAERLKLSLACAPQADLAVDLASFRTAYPDSPLGPYLEGAWRLDCGDEAGLEHLELAITLDINATKPVCEKAFAFLKEREDARADGYQRRWTERDEFERKVTPQLELLDLTHELRAHELPEAQLAAITGLMQLHRAGVARAYLARRVLPDYPGVMTYVLALDLEPAPPRLEAPHDIVNRITQTGPWPVHVIVCTLDGKNAVLTARLQALPGASLYLHD